MLCTYGFIYSVCVYAFAKFFASLTVNGGSIGTAIMNGPQAWAAIAWVGHWLSFLLGFTVIQLVCNEFEFRTNKQNIIDGYSPAEYYAGKIMLVLGVSILASLLYIVIAAISAGAYFAGEVVAAFTLACVGTLSLALIFAFFARRAGPAGFLFLAYPVILEPIINYLLSGNSATGMSQFLPAEAFSRLTPFPVSQSQWGGDLNFAHNSLIAVCVVIGLWSLSYLAFSYSDR